MNWFQKLFCPDSNTIALKDREIAAQNRIIIDLLSENARIRSQNQTLNFTFESSVIKTIEADQLENTLKSEFKNSEIKLADRQYKYTTLAELQRWASFDPTNELKYRAEELDCDKFALTDMADFKKEANYQLGNGAFGLCWGNTTSNGYHAWNIAYVDKGIVMLEPQTDEIWKWTDNQKYKPDFIYI